LSRYDKYDPYDGGFRGPLNAAVASANGFKAYGVGVNSTGKIVVGGGTTGVVGVMISHGVKNAGDIVDVMTDGEIVEFTETDGTAATAGTKYYAADYDGAVTTDSTPVSLGTVTFTDSGDVVTVSADHDLAVDDPVIVGTVTSTTGITAGTVYYVKTAPTATTLTLSATVGGGTLALTTNGSSTAIYKATSLTNTYVGHTVELDRLICRVAR
jgi:hypothetical protein